MTAREHASARAGAGTAERGRGVRRPGPGAAERLQRQMGNRLFRQLLSGSRPLLQRCACGGTCAHCRAQEQGTPPVQAKLRVGPAGDAFEREADRVADAVVRQPGGSAEGVRREPLDGAAAALQRQEETEEEERELVQAKPSGARRGSDGGPAPAAAADVLRTPGQPLDPAARAFMEPRFGRDFGGVRVHTGPQAEAAARSVDARAYTVGQHLVFGAGEYAPGGDAGRRLLAHELTHVVQQGAAGPGGDVGRGGPLGPRIQRGKKDAGPCAGGVKTVAVDMLNLRGNTRNVATDLAYANTVFQPCCVQFTLGKNPPVTTAQSDSWLGGDTDMSVGSCGAPTGEELGAWNGAEAALSLSSRFRAFYVGSISSGALGDSYFPSCATGTAGPLSGMITVTSGAANRTLAHEFGHMLLDAGNTLHTTHPGGTENLMEPTATATGEKLEASQCATIYANA